MQRDKLKILEEITDTNLFPEEVLARVQYLWHLAPYDETFYHLESGHNVAYFKNVELLDPFAVEIGDKVIVMPSGDNGNSSRFLLVTNPSSQYNNNKFKQNLFSSPFSDFSPGF